MSTGLIRGQTNRFRNLDGSAKKNKATNDEAVVVDSNPVSKMTALAEATMQQTIVSETTTTNVEESYSQNTVSSLVARAKLQGYEGESCTECANSTMVRNGTCLKYDTCGTTSGCS